MLTPFDKGLVRGACEGFMQADVPMTPWQRAILVGMYAEHADGLYLGDVLIRYCDWRIRRDRRTSARLLRSALEG